MRILLIGGNGTVGTVLRQGLVKHRLTSIDLPEVDVREYPALVKAMRGFEVVINLAWTVHPEAEPDQLALDNISMTHNVFEAAKATGVKRVIMASSVHADNFYSWDTAEQGYMPVHKSAVPTSPYGASKIFMESLGAFYAIKAGLEVICLRLGAVRPGDIQPDDPFEQAVWLRHHDLIRLIKRCLTLEKIPDQFALLYAVSDNQERIHDLSNSLGWQPEPQWRFTWPTTSSLPLPSLEKA